MIRENQVFEAKVFLRSYRDALFCIQQTVAKKKSFEQYQKMVLQAKEEEDEQAVKILKFSR
jgi:hypothetical protein